MSELNFFSGGGAWAVLAALVVSIAVFGKMLAWPALGGGALLPLRQTVTALWGDTAWGLRDVGLGVVGPADPFAGVIAVLGTFWPAAPSFALVLLWLGALPLAVLGGWFAATRVTDRASLRILAGVLWHSRDLPHRSRAGAAPPQCCCTCCCPGWCTPPSSRIDPGELREQHPS